MNRRNWILGASALSLTAGWWGGPVRASQGPMVRFGQSASLSGGQASYGRDIRDGIRAAFAAATSATGVRFELVTLDDGGVKGNCVKNVSTLIEGGVSGVVGLTSDSGAEACLPAAVASQTAMLGIASGTMGIRSQSGAAFHVRAGYDLEYLRMAHYIKDFGMRRIGVVTLKDTSPANLAAMNQALSILSITPVEAIAVDNNATSFTEVGNRLLAAKLDLVLFATNASPVAAIIDQMSKARYAGLFYASSFAGQDLMSTLAERKQSCVMSMVVPRPNSKGMDVVDRCRRDLAALGSDVTLGMTTLEGYIAGRTAVEAARAVLRATGGERVSRARLRDALAGLRTDLGGYRVEFGPGVTQGSQYVDLIAIDRWGRFVG